MTGPVGPPDARVAVCTLTHIWTGPDSHSVAIAIARPGLIGTTDHDLYIGRELMKAEVAQRLGLPYSQDGPLQLT